jgi:hypothetical protein
VKFHVSEVDGVRTRFVEISMKWDKAHKCKLGNTRPRDPNEGVPRINGNPNDTLCPNHFIAFFLHPMSTDTGDDFMLQG